MTKKRLSRRQLIKRHLIPRLHLDASISTLQTSTKKPVGIMDVDYGNHGSMCLLSIRLIRDLINSGVLKEYQTRTSNNATFTYYDYINGKRCPWHCECGKQCSGLKKHIKDNTAHQCSIHFDPFSSTATYCSHTLDHKHLYQNTGCVYNTPDGKRIEIPKCKYCSYSMPYEQIKATLPANITEVTQQ